MSELFVSGITPTEKKKQLLESPDGRPYNIADCFRTFTKEELQKHIKSNAFQYGIMAINIEMCLNISNMIRTANLCGVKKMVLFGRRKFDGRGCVGAQNYVDIEKISGISNPDLIDFDDLTKTRVDEMLDETVFLDYIKSNQLLPVFIEQDKFSKPANNANIKNIILRSQELNRMPIFILVNERFGIPKNILDTRYKTDISFTLELQQMGCIRSFNVANACSILCYKIMEVFQELE